MAVGDGALARRRLDRLISYRGRGKVLEILVVDDVTLTGLLDGSLDWPADAREKFDRVWSMLVSVGAAEEVSDEGDETPESGAPEEIDEAAAAEALALAPDSGSGENPTGGGAPAVVDAKPDAVVTDGGMVRRRIMAEPDDRAQDLLWRARYLVITRYLLPERGVPRHRRLAAWAVLLRLEIELIRHFQFPLPRLWKSEKIWDVGQRQRQISLRVEFLRCVKRREQQQHLRRLIGWLLGRDEDRDELLLQRILDDAEKRGPVDPVILVHTEPDWRELERTVGPRP